MSLPNGNLMAQKLTLRIVLQPRCGRYSFGASLPSIRSRASWMPPSSSLSVIRWLEHGTKEWMGPAGQSQQLMGQPLRKGVRITSDISWDRLLRHQRSNCRWNRHCAIHPTDRISMEG